jgi:hypothetical protein
MAAKTLSLQQAASRVRVQAAGVDGKPIIRLAVLALLEW